MRILATGDWHGDAVTLGVPRFDEVKDAVDEAVHAAIKREVDVFAFLGDLTDPDSGGSTMRSIALLSQIAIELNSAGITFIAIAGNHDVEEDGTGATTLTPLQPLEDLLGDVFIVEKPRVIGRGMEDREEIINFICLPYPSATSSPRDIAEVTTELIKDNAGPPFVVLAHLMIASAQQGSETTEMPRGREVSFPIEQTHNATARLNGHYHRRQTTPEGIIIPGSLARLTFGEGENDPGYLILEV